MVPAAAERAAAAPDVVPAVRVVPAAPGAKQLGQAVDHVHEGRAGAERAPMAVL